ncbi:MAG: RNA-directed DNA polymerase [Bacteroidetes bacterium]|nr:RNA-directed DNA polymerase [Bacteroidota bacterium]
MAKKIENTDLIIQRFAAMQSITDLLELLNLVKKELYGEKANPFSLRQLNYYSLSKLQAQHYRQWSIPKKNGGERTIHAPVNGLKHVQACLNAILQVLFEPHYAAMGFLPGKSIVDNAKKHASKGFVYNLDLKDFFPSIPRERVWACLLLPPFNLGSSTERRQLANRISFLCTASIEITDAERGKILNTFLPQGAPTSPTITNIIARKLDRRLQGVANKYHLTYSRYADDITFSGNSNVFKKSGEVVLEIRRIIEDQKFQVNDKKVRLQQQGYRQEVTGLIVNEKVNVPRRYYRQLRNWLYLWETYGKEKASKLFLKDYRADKGYKRDGLPDMDCVIGGKLDYLKMVKGQDDPLFAKLNARYLRLSNIESQQGESRSYIKTSQESSKKEKKKNVEEGKEPRKLIETVLEMINRDSFEKAMEYFLSKK